jgi:hypothetical protein
MTSPAVRPAAFDRWRRGWRRSRAGRLACCACGLVLGGCAAVCDEYTDGFAGRGPRAVGSIPVARREALLRTPPRPACETDAPDKQRDAGAAPNGAEASLALRIKLEYERECYRQAEKRVREQLRALQAAVVKAGKTQTASAPGAP